MIGAATASIQRGLQQAVEMPRGIRLNNPTLIRLSSIAWQGKIVGSDRDFETFLTLADGIRAGARNQMTHWRRGAKTVRALVTLQAPASDHNPTEAYIAFVAGMLKLGADDYVPLDVMPNLPKLIGAMIAIECAHWPVPDDLIHTNCIRALA
jgi:hypothetical protein